MKITMIRIMHRKGRTFSAGGMRACFTREGKTWNSLGRLHAHLRMLQEYRGSLDVYAGCFIVEVTVDLDSKVVKARGYPIEEDLFYAKTCVKN